MDQLDYEQWGYVEETPDNGLLRGVLIALGGSFVLYFTIAVIALAVI